MKIEKTVISLGLTLLLTACGGGGEESEPQTIQRGNPTAFRQNLGEERARQQEAEARSNWQTNTGTQGNNITGSSSLGSEFTAGSGSAYIKPGGAGSENNWKMVGLVLALTFGKDLLKKGAALLKKDKKEEAPEAPKENTNVTATQIQEKQEKKKVEAIAANSIQCKNEDKSASLETIIKKIFEQAEEQIQEVKKGS